VTYAAEETRDPRRTIPRALMLGVAAVVAIYLALNAAYLLVLPLDRVLASNRIAADAALAVAGPTAAAAISTLVVVSALGAMTGIILAGPRVYYAMAHDGLLFGWMGAIHPRFRSPHAAIAAQAIWASVLVLTDTYRALFTRVVYTEWIFFGALALGVMRQRDVHAGVSSLGVPCRPGAVCVDVPGDRVESNRRRTDGERVGPGACGRWAARLLPLAAGSDGGPTPSII
jgi:APA family basic amino acid/polyamine antiporter